MLRLKRETGKQHGVRVGMTLSMVGVRCGVKMSTMRLERGVFWKEYWKPNLKNESHNLTMHRIRDCRAMGLYFGKPVAAWKEVTEKGSSIVRGSVILLSERNSPFAPSVLRSFYFRRCYSTVLYGRLNSQSSASLSCIRFAN